ncbi:hypothetical protein Kisp02_67950 [Kineosporia sp. NBRC 101731]|nr:hypothetical protein Kisp02_67950 [Kineosporia sp. NBRC 101731]
MPLILGVQHLSDDLVLLATQEGTTVLTARIDLNAVAEQVVWASIRHALTKAAAEQVHLVAFPHEPVTDQVLESLHRDLVHLAATAPAWLTIGWVITSAHGQWWLHDLNGSAPLGAGSAGREDPPVTLALKLARGVPAGSHQEVEAATAPHPSAVLDGVRQALAALPQGRLRSVRRVAAGEALSVRRERPVQWGAVEAAGVLDALMDVQVRDELVIRSDEAHTSWTWSSLLPFAPPAWVAPVATLAAFAAYQHGHSILARVSLARALDADPEYTLARLLQQAMQMAMSPQDIRQHILAPAHDKLSPASENGSL